MINRICLIAVLLRFLTAPIDVKAQHLPSIQTASVRAPDDVKIDGKLDEWGGKLQANNHVNRFLYTISNDDDNLYLSILFKDSFAIDKVLEGGLTFTISHSKGKAREKDVRNSIVTYPILTNRTRNTLRGNIHVFFSFRDRDTVANRNYLDSLIAVENKRADIFLKQIQVTGLRGINDTILSVHNTEGIEAALHFGKRMACTYELAIPLKHLGLSINSPVNFSYNLKLNGEIEKIDPTAPEIIVTGNVVNYDGLYDESVTDFWGEYVLAKKTPKDKM